MNTVFYRTFRVLALLPAVLLPACKSIEMPAVPGVTPYRMVIQQGNFISQEMVSQLKPGMTREQVRFILGTPLVTDIFHADRWDYVFTIRRQGAEPQNRKVVARFDADVLKSLDTGGELPAEHDFVASIDTFKTSRNAPPLVLTDEQMKALPAPAPVTPTQVEPTGPGRSYPPLEPRS